MQPYLILCSLVFLDVVCVLGKLLLHLLAGVTPYKPWRKKIRELRGAKYFQRQHVALNRHRMRLKYRVENYFDIPIFIISFNRLSCLQTLIGRLENKGYINIHIVDNCSTYPPLLEYLKNSQYNVHYLDKNYGHLAIWKDNQFTNITQKSFYVVTDPDVVPADSCPNDFLQLFYDLLSISPYATKVGFGLRINDLPDHYQLKDSVIEWEKQFYTHESKFQGETIYHADIDTTFALYGPQKILPINYDFYSAIRTGVPYIAQHLPWYKDSSKLTEEDHHYYATQDGSNNY